MVASASARRRLAWRQKLSVAMKERQSNPRTFCGGAVRKSVGCFFNGEFVKWYEAISYVIEDGYNRRAVQNCLAGRAKTTGGATWKYMDRPRNDKDVP
jgi:hypothetical protein